MMDIGFQRGVVPVALAVSCVNDHAWTVWLLQKSELVRRLEAIFHAPGFVAIPPKIFKVEDYRVKSDG